MKTLNLGKIPYLEAYKIQKQTVEQVKEGAEETLIICSHDPVVTLGKSSGDNETGLWQGEVAVIERGGKATYHGPGQIIIYPIINLKNRGQNIAGFLTAMETSMIQYLNDYEINAQGNPFRGNPDLTGIWINNQKIASIGVAIKRWVTYHGLAINIFDDPLAFQGINPCGIDSSQMTSLEKIIGPETQLNREHEESKLLNYLVKNLESLS